MTDTSRTNFSGTFIGFYKTEQNKKQETGRHQSNRKCFPVFHLCQSNHSNCEDVERLNKNTPGCSTAQWTHRWAFNKTVFYVLLLPPQWSCGFNPSSVLMLSHSNERTYLDHVSSLKTQGNRGGGATRSWSHSAHQSCFTDVESLWLHFPSATWESGKTD